MRKLLTLITILLTFAGISQTRRINLIDRNIDGMYCRKILTIKETGDSIYFVYIGFQNKKYESITDIRSIMFDLGTDSSEIKQMTKDLRASLPEIGKKQSIDWDRKRYRLAIVDFTDEVFLWTKDGATAYTTMKKSTVNSLLLFAEDCLKNP